MLIEVVVDLVGTLRNVLLRLIDLRLQVALSIIELLLTIVPLLLAIINLLLSVIEVLLSIVELLLMLTFVGTILRIIGKTEEIVQFILREWSAAAQVTTIECFAFQGIGEFVLAREVSIAQGAVAKIAAAKVPIAQIAVTGTRGKITCTRREIGSRGTAGRAYRRPGEISTRGG